MPEFENLEPFIRKGKGQGTITPVAPFSGSPQNYKPVKRDNQRYTQKPSILRVPKAENVEMIDLREMEKAYRIADRNHKHKPQPARRNDKKKPKSNPFERLIQAIKSFFLPKKKQPAKKADHQRQRSQQSNNPRGRNSDRDRSRNSDRDNRRPPQKRQGSRQRSEQGDKSQNRPPRPPRKQHSNANADQGSRNPRPPQENQVPEKQTPQPAPPKKENRKPQEPIIALKPQNTPSATATKSTDESAPKLRNRRNRRRTSGPSSQTFTPNSNDFNQ